MIKGVNTDSTGAIYTLVIYSRKRISRGGKWRTEWRWNLKARNGRIVAESGEGYQNKSDLVEIVNSIFGKATVIEFTENEQ